LTAPDGPNSSGNPRAPSEHYWLLSHSLLEANRMTQPILSADLRERDPAAGFTAAGEAFALREWRGSGPAKLHVHHADDEAWHVIEGVLRFRFADRALQVGAGETVFVPAGVPHTYEAVDARYLVVLTPRLVRLIDELHTHAPSEHAAVYRKYFSELLE